MKRGYLMAMEVIKWLCAVLLFVIIGKCLMCNRVSDAPFSRVSAAATKHADMDMMKEGSVQMVKRLYGLRQNDYEDIALYYPKSNMGSEELLVIKLKDVDQQEVVKAAIEGRLAVQKKNFNGYGTYQLGMLNRSIVEMHGNYVLFISGNDPNAVAHDFDKAL